MDPLFFHPLVKRIVWGGRRLGELLGKPIGDHDDAAESWEVVDHGEDQSVVARGPLAGQTLHQLLTSRGPQLLGRRSQADQFPLLLKFLDCHRVLSVQVHPDDTYASRMPQPDRGKTEAWYIIDSAPESVIYAGLKQGVDAEALQRAVTLGRAEEVLHAFHPEPGQCVFIPAGTVHALGGGLVVAEIQQSSDTTFRLYDWNRSGPDGRPRPLHLQRALEVTDYAGGPVHPQTPRPDGDGLETLVRCDHFILRRLRLGGDRGPEPPGRLGGDGVMRIVTVVQGAAMLQHTGSSVPLPIGQSFLLPACCDAVTLVSHHRPTTLLVAHLP